MSEIPFGLYSSRLQPSLLRIAPRSSLSGFRTWTHDDELPDNFSSATELANEVDLAALNHYGTDSTFVYTQSPK